MGTGECLCTRESVNDCLPKKNGKKPPGALMDEFFPGVIHMMKPLLSGIRTHPRGSAIAKPESPYGCFDMAGSVWEWTSDWYKPYPG